MGDESSKPAVTSTGAVFLSYASQDAEAAQRICAALRSAGVEVWFDQSELRGGDVWDQSIRKQIKTCAVFLPVISRNTHDRDEGYFRLEWKLAVDRSHLMAADKAFLLPVVIDETRDDDERVPDRFREVQWTCLPAGETPPEFARRIRQLLSGEATSSMTGARAPPAASSRRSSRLKSAWLAAAVALAVVAAYLLVEKPWIAKSAAFAPPVHSIAVLPFVNMSGDKEQEYFSDGLTEELLNSLAEINELQVAARTSAFSFKGMNTDIPTIARKLNVGAVLEGSVRRSGNTVRVTTQLINAVTGFHLWSHTYDRDLGDVLKLETDIAGAVASALKVSLLGDAAAKIELGGTRNPAAFDAYLHASKAYANASEEKGFQEAIAAYTEAINLDPGFARAFAGRSRALLNYAEEGAAEEPFESAQRDARQAIVLAPELADGHVALGRFFISRLDIAHAHDEISRAAALAPGNVDTLRTYGYFTSILGHGYEAIAAIRRAVVLDPLDVHTYLSLGSAFTRIRHYDEAMAAYRDALTLEPGRLNASLSIGFTYYSLGNFESARSVCEPKRDSWQAQMCLALAYQKLGRHSDAEAMLAKVRSKFADAGAYGYTYVYAQWGDIAEALKWLDTAFRLRDNDLLSMKTDPLMDPLRKEPRFQAIERELKFPD
jgi:TolB-like protein/Tfp pilus assembly protein PilF